MAKFDINPWRRRRTRGLDRQPPGGSRYLAVDLTPMTAGGVAGGAQVLALDLIRRIRQLAPHHRLLLLTTAANDGEVAGLVDPTVERLRILPDGSWPDGAAGLRDRGVDLLFCPFTAPIHVEPGVPVVSILYDLQHLYYPQFFTPEEVGGRNTHLARLRHWSDVVVCISEHARQTLLEQVGFPADRTRVVPIAIHDRLRRVSPERVRSVQARCGVERDYVLYPANGWPHKNHRLLLMAFGMMRARRPALDVDLVLTGSLGDARDDLALFARRLGLEARVHLTGHRSDEELAALYQGCRMVAFPSLYEGFGIPLLEAMYFEKPVACSATTSLPEVGGDAVRYFDPRRPEAIADAMLGVLADAGAASELVQRGRQRLASFSGEAMAAAYLEVFEEVLRLPRRPADSVTGVFADGWTGKVMRLGHAGGSTRMLEVDLEVPSWLPLEAIAVQLHGSSRWRSPRWQLTRGTRRTLQVKLPRDPGHLSFAFAPLFRPCEHGMGADSRLLGCLCRSVSIRDAQGSGPNLLSIGDAGA